MDSSTAEIARLLSVMQDGLERNKIKISLNNYTDFVPAHMREEALDWLTKLESGAYADWLKVWKMQSEEHWKRYLLWDDFKDYREVRMLKAASANLKKECKSVPALFNRRKCTAVLDEMSKQ